MANLSFLRVEGVKQGLISAGCNTQHSIGKKYQSHHKDEISICAVSHSLMQGEGTPIKREHSPISVTKFIDKSSPLLAQAWANSEQLDCVLTLYRTSGQGRNEGYYEIKLKGARIASISLDIPSVQDEVGEDPQEVVTLAYRDIDWKHLIAGTLGRDRWETQVL
ncbi:Hcp family type VI secretion system effector [Vibrio rumoiensis]|uniref:Type VI secretion system protein n=1 Tax=Vibrio rumoiensis 1S-45 TaxID=1188252 RepID=A0A1E5DZB3_9VIBR|nr:Hcp family type VI secretion system effector [Vibrio rumoiensis]OEF23264.1 hypothetical protein A1QC_12225 [Vibrio rumoiensis 1S-45]